MYAYIFSAGISPHPAIDSMGFSDDTKITRFGPGQRSLYIIHYVTKGKGYYNGNPVKAGQGFLISPGQLEEYHPDMDEPWEFLWVISADDAMKTIFDRYNANPETQIFDYDFIPAVKKIAGEIIYNNNSILDYLQILEMFLHIYNSHTFNRSASESKPDSEIYLGFALNYIETNIYKQITVNELTKLLGISQPYLYKIFTGKFNMSPKQYITNYKLHRAKKLLVDTDMSVTQIANSVGYSDILAFSRIFSLKEKISPQKYRAAMRHSNNACF